MSALPSKLRSPIRFGKLIFTAACFCLSITSLRAADVTINVACGGGPVGQININGNNPMNGAISGSFDTTLGGGPGSIAAAEAQCDEQFNWFQVVLTDNDPPPLNNGTFPVPPYVDPPLNTTGGGYDYVWSDNLAWYYNMQAPPNGIPNCVGGMLGPPQCYAAGLDLAANTTNTALNYYDAPGGNPGTQLTFLTCLVSVDVGNGNPSGFVEFLGGFNWGWTNGANGKNPMVANLAQSQDCENYNPTTVAGLRNFDRVTNPPTTPEPSSLLLMASGVCSLLGLGRRKKV